PFRVILWGKITVPATVRFAKQCCIYHSASFFSHLYNRNRSFGDPDLYQFVSQQKIVTCDPLKRILHTTLKSGFIFSDYS
ncbi:hypothetical protein Q2317_25475, partial [Escherichia coli]|nr:hypothetical protein [Escherichia coli]